MIDTNDFAKNFRGSPTPDALQKLLDFQNNVSGPHFYANGFELIFSDPPGILETYSSQPEFLNALCIFAQVTASGSDAAIWRVDDQTDPSLNPIVVFGDEGGYFVVAQNLLEFLQILTVDVAMFGTNIQRGQGDPVSAASAQYREWLKTNFGLDAIRDATAIIAAAQAKHQAAFEAWIGKFYS
jgi:hypothetical protein